MAKPHNDDSDAGVEWGTPPKYVEPLAELIGGFDLDPASGAEPKPYAETRYTEEEDGLITPWFGHVWLNPPYGRKENPEWAERTFDQIENTKSITALVPAAMSTDWFQEYYSEADVFCFIDTRLEFIGGEDSASFANVICVFGLDELPEGYIDQLQEFGLVLENVEDERSIFDY